MHPTLLIISTLTLILLLHEFFSAIYTMIFGAE